MTGAARDFEHNRLAGHARPFRFDARLEPVADAMDRGDAEAWRHLHPQLIDQASVYRDFRAHYRRAVDAGAIPDDRGPSAA